MSKSLYRGGHVLMRRSGIALGLFAGLMAVSPAAEAQSYSTRQGVLTCRTGPSVGLVVGSRQRLVCQFKSDRGAVQNYFGTIGRVGLDLGITAAGVMAWAVVTSTANIPSGALAGEFVGASG